jgi:Domain of unknown function (DUF4278)
MITTLEKQPVQNKPVQNKLIQLIYRGSTYSYDPDLVRARSPLPHTDKSSCDLIYRGSTYHFDPALTRPDSVEPSSYELICRGSTYQVYRNEKGEVIHKSTSY